MTFEGVSDAILNAADELSEAADELSGASLAWGCNPPYVDDLFDVRRALFAALDEVDRLQSLIDEVLDEES